MNLRWLYLVAPWPALILGAVLMHSNALPAVVWGQNLVAGLLLTIVCVGVLLAPRFRLNQRAWIALGTLAIGVLLLTVVDAGSEGVHRWVRVGHLRLHAAAICLPVLILALGSGREMGASQPIGALVPLVGLGVAMLLVWQPDAAQTTAFAGSLLVLLGFGRAQSGWVWLAGFASVVCAIWSWHRPDPLLPIRHVEGIVGLAAQAGVLCLVASLASLALLPLPFLLAWRRIAFPVHQALALGTYFCLQLLAPCFGPFPVPMMGFGLSPIIGYFLALDWLVARK